MKEKRLEDLYDLYLSNKCTEEDLKSFFMLLKGNRDAEMIGMMSETWDNTPVRSKEIKLDPTAKWKWRIGKWTSIAAALLIITGFLYFFRNDMFSTPASVRVQQILSLSGQRKQLKLADGTRVWLSPNSQLDYPDKFTGNQRLISLQGEAFFEVAHDTKHPFIIKTGKVSTTVLGTSFNISAYENNKLVNVTLVTGKVAVVLKTKNNTRTEMMLPNQRIIVDIADDKLTRINFPEAASFLNKRVGIFEYKGATLEEVVKDIESQYGLSIQTENELANRSFYGNLNMNDAIEQTLDKLSLVMETTWKKNGGQYVIIK